MKCIQATEELLAEKKHATSSDDILLFDHKPLHMI